jgi:hypothetical protein
LILQIIWNLENKSRHALTNKVCELHNNLFIEYLFLFPIVIFILLVKVLWLFTAKKLANTNKNINKICLLVYCNDIYRPNFSITKSVGIYRRNHSGNKKNKKKPNNMIMCKFLQTILPTTLDRWYNLSMNIPTENFYRYILTTLRTILQWD